MAPLVITEKGVRSYVPADNNAWIRAFCRILLNGGPTTGKTTSLTSFPGTPDKPRRIIIVPGEMGHSSIQETPEQEKYYWEIDDELNKQDVAQRYLAQLRGVIADVLKKQNSFLIALDGIHKLFTLIQYANGWPDKNEKLWGDKAFGKGASVVKMEFNSIMQSILTSTTPYIAATVYDGPEPIETGSSKMITLPALPGDQAKLVMGLFPCVFHTEKVSDGTKSVYKWRLEALGDMQGAGIHVPKHLRSMFPQTVEADWKHIQAILDKATATTA